MESASIRVHAYSWGRPSVTPSSAPRSQPQRPREAPRGYGRVASAGRAQKHGVTAGSE